MVESSCIVFHESTVFFDMISFHPLLTTVIRMFIRENSSDPVMNLSINDDATIDVEDLAADVARVCRCEIHEGGGNLDRLAWTTHGNSHAKLLDRAVRHRCRAVKTKSR